MTQTRMSPSEFRSVRHTLGFSGQKLADHLGVREDTLRRWERGKEPIPYRVRDELAVITRDQIVTLEMLAYELGA